MSRELTLQDPGEGISEAEIVEVLVAVGDHVDDGDTVMTVETDKATSEVASPFSGEVESVEVEAGQTVQVGDLLLQFSDGAEAEDAEEPEEPEGEELESEEEPEEAEEEKPVGNTEPVPASPATRRRARDLGVDLHDIEPSGPHGRVTTADVEQAGQEPESESESESEERAEQPETAAGEEAEPSADADRWGPVERQPLRGVRKAIARQMSASWGPIARVTHHDLADVTELERLRRRHAGRIEAMEGELSLLVPTMKAVAAALRSFPRLNSSLDDDEIVLKQYIHLGIAVDTDDGLLVPVVRDVDRKSMTDLALELPELVRRTRDRDLARDEMQGASFTITNVGPLGGAAFTPMVDHPQVAILGMASARVEPRVVHGDIDDEPTDIVVEPRYVLPLSLSFDHRVIDGADAARFVTSLVRSLEDPEQLLLSL